MQIMEEEVIKDIEEGKLYRGVPVTGYSFSVSLFHDKMNTTKFLKLFGRRNE